MNHGYNMPMCVNCFADLAEMGVTAIHCFSLCTPDLNAKVEELSYET